MLGTLTPVCRPPPNIVQDDRGRQQLEWQLRNTWYMLFVVFVVFTSRVFKLGRVGWSTHFTPSLSTSYYVLRGFCSSRDRRLARLPDVTSLVPVFGNQLVSAFGSMCSTRRSLMFPSKMQVMGWNEASSRRW